MARPLRRLALAALTCAATAGAAHADSFSFAGSFTTDDENRLFSFRTVGTGDVTIETFGYAGGTDASGRTVAAGGFDPVFALFDQSGQLLAYGDDGATRIDPVTGAAFDAALTQTLGAGTYYVLLAQYDNYAIGPTLSEGSLEAGNPTFTAAFGCAAGRFCDITAASRSGSYDISISGLQVAQAVPEPAMALMLGLGAPLLWLAARRRPAAA